MKEIKISLIASCFVGIVFMAFCWVFNNNGKLEGFCNGIYSYNTFNEIDYFNNSGGTLVHCVGESSAGWYKYPNPIQVFPSKQDF